MSRILHRGDSMHSSRSSNATVAITSNYHLAADGLGGVVWTADDHHAQSHVLATTTGLGADHTTSGLTTGQVLRATGATTAAFAQLGFADLGGTLSDAQHGTRAVANPHSVTAAVASDDLGSIKQTADTIYRLTLGLDPSGLAQIVLTDGVTAGNNARLFHAGGGPIIAVGASDVLDLGPGQLYLPDEATLDANAGAVRLSDATAGDEALEVYAGGAARGIDLRGDLMAFSFSLPSSAFVATATITMRFGAGYIAGSAFDRQPIPWAYSIVGVSVRTSSARTGGTLNFEAVNNGVASGFMARLDGTNTTINSAVQVAGLDTGLANGTIGAQIITSGWTPNPVNVYGAVYVLLQRV